jgi:hypothetical protein
MLKPLVAIAPVLIAATSCATIPPEQRLNPAETALACQLTRGLGGPDFNQTAANKLTPELARLSEQDEGMIWKPLPKSLRCAGGRRRITQLDEQGFGSFIDRIGLSRDGSFAAISGGYQIGELSGGGGTCYFKRHGSNWVRVGCAETWAS